MTLNRVLQETLLSTLHHLSSRQHSRNGGQWLAISYVSSSYYKDKRLLMSPQQYKMAPDYMPPCCHALNHKSEVKSLDLNMYIFIIS